LFSWVILSNYTLNTAKAITQEEIKQTLLKFSLLPRFSSCCPAPHPLMGRAAEGGGSTICDLKNDQFGHYLALEGIYLPLWAVLPNNPTLRIGNILTEITPRSCTGLSPSLAPRSRGLISRTLSWSHSQNYNSRT